MIDRSYKIDRFYFLFISFSIFFLSGLPRCAWNSWARWTKRTTCECLLFPWYVHNICSQSELQEIHCLFHSITPTFPLSAANGAISRFSQLLLSHFRATFISWFEFRGLQCRRNWGFNVVMIGDQRKAVHSHWKWGGHCTVCGMDIPCGSKVDDIKINKNVSLFFTPLSYLHFLAFLSVFFSSFGVILRSLWVVKSKSIWVIWYKVFTRFL